MNKEKNVIIGDLESLCCAALVNDCVYFNNQEVLSAMDAIGIKEFMVEDGK